MDLFTDEEAEAIRAVQWHAARVDWAAYDRARGKLTDTIAGFLHPQAHRPVVPSQSPAIGQS